jgi:ankyrin repeat protein
MRCLISAAARVGDLATIKRLHAKGVDVTHVRDSYGVTAIMLAAMHGHFPMVKFLQAAGASIVVKDDHGYSALRYAAFYGNWSIVHYFLQEVGVSISDASDDGRTVWDLLELQQANPMALASLLKITIMLDDPPPYYVAKLSWPAHANLIRRGRHFRAQLPSHLEQQ